jgi:dephospho-CoA kinase
VKVFKLSIYIITGQIGSGKTEAMKIFSENGYSCFCADEIVRKLYKNKNIIKKIGNIYPGAIINNSIDLDILREKIFNNTKIMELVENYIQPLVFIEFEKIIKLNKEKLVFAIPIIKKNIFFKKYKILYIKSKYEIRKKRISKRNNYGNKMIENIIKYQNSIDSYKNDNYCVIENNGTLNDLKNKIYKIID